MSPTKRKTNRCFHNSRSRIKHSGLALFTQPSARLAAHENLNPSNSLLICVCSGLRRRPRRQFLSTHGTPPGSAPENYPEKSYFSKIWNTEVVTNVTKPSLTVFRPAPNLANGTAVVICPGGGFMALSINSEGNELAKYLAEKGVTAFVLKYRLAHTGEDATQEFTALFADRAEI